MPPTDSDRDDLARIIHTVTKDAHWQTWEQTSDGIRAWCRAKADDAMAAGWRKVGVQDVVVNKDDLREAMYAMEYVGEYLYGKWDYAGMSERFTAALADPAGANDGE